MTDQKKDPVFLKLLTWSWLVLGFANVMIGIIDWPSFQSFLVLYLMWCGVEIIVAISLIVMLLMRSPGWRSAVLWIVVAAVGIVTNAWLIGLTMP